MDDAPSVHSLGYMPRLDGLRALAIGGVLIEHFFPMPVMRMLSPGGAGVSLFFVLSGYLITRILLGYKRRKTPLGTAASHFYARRLLRLSPVYYLAIAVATVLALNNLPQTWWVHALYLSNFQLALAGRWLGGPDHFWSLCVEEQFYLLWFFVVMLIPTRFLPHAIFTSFAVTFLYRAGAYFFGYSPLSSVLLPANMALLAAGALVAWIGLPMNPRKYDALLLDRRVIVISGAAFAALCLSLPFARAPNALLYPFIGAAFFACLVRRAADPHPDPWLDWLGWAPLRHIGKISYGIFVYHLFLPDFFMTYTSRIGLIVSQHGWNAFFVLTVSSILVAEISWVLMEQPLLRLKPAIAVKGAAVVEIPRQP